MVFLVSKFLSTARKQSLSEWHKTVKNNICYRRYSTGLPSLWILWVTFQMNRNWYQFKVHYMIFNLSIALLNEACPVSRLRSRAHDKIWSECFVQRQSQDSCGREFDAFSERAEKNRRFIVPSPSYGGAIIENLVAFTRFG